MTNETDRRRISGRGLFSTAQWAAVRDALNLSHRELQIVQGLFDDGSEREIAESLGISQHTVHTYLRRLYRKLDVSTRNQLVIRIFGQHIGLERRPQSENSSHEGRDGDNGRAAPSMPGTPSASAAKRQRRAGHRN